MTKNYLILAHKNPIQLKQTIAQLDDTDSFFFIHIDLNANIEPFREFITGENVIFIEKREKCLWGDFSIVKATIHLIEAVVNHNKGGFSILMSGQDYPIKSKTDINSFLKQYSDYNFIECIPIEQKWNKKMVQDKVWHYHIIHSSKRSDSNSYAPFLHTDCKQKIRTLAHFVKGRLSYENLLKILRFPKRKPFFDRLYAGSQWWAFNEVTLRKIHHFIKENHFDLENYFKYTSAPDEIFFQSIIMYLQQSDPNIQTKPSLTYVNWERKGCQLPVTFQSTDFEEITKQTNSLFARKFDFDVDTEIIRLINSHINS